MVLKCVKGHFIDYLIFLLGVKTIEMSLYCRIKDFRGYFQILDLTRLLETNSFKISLFSNLRLKVLKFLKIVVEESYASVLFEAESWNG